MNPAILDAGPLAAWFCPRDEHYPWASQAFTQIQPGGLLCEAVLTEVCQERAGNRPFARSICRLGCCRTAETPKRQDAKTQRRQKPACATLTLDFEVWA